MVAKPGDLPGPLVTRGVRNPPHTHTTSIQSTSCSRKEQCIGSHAMYEFPSAAVTECHRMADNRKVFCGYSVRKRTGALSLTVTGELILDFSSYILEFLTRVSTVLVFK